MTSKQNTVRKTLKIYQNTQTVRLTTLVFFFKKDVVMALAQVRFISLVYDCMNTFYFSFFFFCFFFFWEGLFFKKQTNIVSINLYLALFISLTKRVWIC